MSVVINTNSAASMAADNLSASGAMLQKSLNRLSSGSKIVDPSDDAGGLAVAMKLSAAAKRQGAVSNNIGNTVSFLQAQDGVLKVTGKVLERIGELKTLYADPTKNSTDLANYNAEFTQLKAELTSLGAEKFNGVSLFGTNSLTVATTEDGTSTVTSAAVGLLGTAGATTNYSFPGGTNISVNLTPPSAGVLTVATGGIYLDDNNGHNIWLNNTGDTATYDGSGGWTFSSGGAPGSNPAGFAGTTVLMQGSISSGLGQWVGTANFVGSATTSHTGTVATAANLGSLSLSTITGAIADVATNRANNGATQSRLNYASELISVNKANLEAANSRIMDVDVAAESTTLARYNILTQAGTSMLTQANQAAQMALKLLG